MNELNGAKPEPVKPSEQIKQMVKKVAQTRADRASAATGIPILGRNTGIVQHLEQDPMTWVMAILAYLDGQDQ